MFGVEQRPTRKPVGHPGQLRQLLGRDVLQEGDLAPEQGFVRDLRLGVADLPDPPNPPAAGHRAEQAGRFGRRFPAIRAVADRPAPLVERRDPAVRTGVGRADRFEEPRFGLHGRPGQLDFEPIVGGRLDPVEQVGPAGVEGRRRGHGSIGERPGHVERGDRPRTVGPARSELEADPQALAQLERLERRQELLAGLAPEPRLVVEGEERHVEQSRDPRRGGRVRERADPVGQVVDPDGQGRLGPKGLAIRRLQAVEFGPGPRRLGQAVDPIPRARPRGLGHQRLRAVDEPRAGVPGLEMVGGERLELADQPPAAPQITGLERTVDPQGIGGRQLVGQPRIIGLAGLEVDQESEPSRVVFEEGRHAFLVEQFIHAIVEPSPVRVARFDQLEPLERPDELVVLDQTVGLGEQHVFEIVDILDRGPLDLEVAGLAIHEVDDDHLIRLAVVFLLERIATVRPGLVGVDSISAMVRAFLSIGGNGRVVSGSTSKFAPSVRMIRSNGADLSKSFDLGLGTAGFARPR